ncbi:unnamed protein product [Agarophyton chilense]
MRKPRPHIGVKYLLPVFFIPSLIVPLLNLPPPTLPPPLAPLTSQFIATYPPHLNDWKRPLTIAAYARRSNSKYELSLFTTGTNARSFGRTFKVFGCLIGDVPINTSQTFPELTVCEVDPGLLADDIPISVLLYHDENLHEAMKSSFISKHENFSIFPGDVVPFHPGDSYKIQAKLAYIRTSVRWHKNLLENENGLRYELCIMTAMRQEPHLLDEWIEYYRRMGVDYFYIYENNAETPIHLKKFAHFVEIVAWPWSRSQMQSNNHFLKASAARCKYVAFFDADEYVMVGDVRPGALKYYVFQKTFIEGFQQLSFPFLNMINNGYVHRPRGYLPELYTTRERNQTSRLGKMLIDTDNKWVWHSVHKVDALKDYPLRTYWNNTREYEPTSIMHNSMLVHFTHRSWEDYCAKNTAGGASTLTAMPERHMNVNNPDPDYMGRSGTEFFFFRNLWREIMKHPDQTGLTLMWKNSKGEQCRQLYCPKWPLQLFLKLLEFAFSNGHGSGFSDPECKPGTQGCLTSIHPLASEPYQAEMPFARTENLLMGRIKVEDGYVLRYQ